MIGSLAITVVESFHTIQTRHPDHEVDTPIFVGHRVETAFFKFVSREFIQNKVTGPFLAYRDFIQFGIFAMVSAFPVNAVHT